MNKIEISKRATIEAMKSISQGNAEEALLHLSTSLSMMGHLNDYPDFEFLKIIKNENLLKEIKRSALSSNISKIVPLFVSKEIEAVGSSEDFKSHMENREELNLFTQIFMGSLQNSPKAIGSGYLQLENETKSFFSKDFHQWAQIINNK